MSPFTHATYIYVGIHTYQPFYSDLEDELYSEVFPYAHSAPESALLTFSRHCGAHAFAASAREVFIAKKKTITFAHAR
jgi:hypothetical protein